MELSSMVSVYLTVIARGFALYMFVLLIGTVFKKHLYAPIMLYALMGTGLLAYETLCSLLHPYVHGYPFYLYGFMAVANYFLAKGGNQVRVNGFVGSRT